jgi:UPF0755 protein
MKFLGVLKKIFTMNNLFALAISAGAIIYVLNITNPDDNKAIVFIEKGSDTKTILEKLQEQGIIRNRITYGLAYILTKISGEPEAGAYYFRNGMSALAINSKFKDPDYKYISIQEGWRKEQIASAYAKVLEWDDSKEQEFASKFPICPVSGREGYLSPGDYLISKNATVQSILTKMEDKFSEKFAGISKVKNSANIFDEDQVVKIASLIQREAGGKSDMRLISGIIWNRILKEMPLQIDATLQYVKGDEDNWWPVPKSADKFLDSPYNLYQNKGLPPTPISNPGLAAIEAAMNPIQTSCLYYLHDKRGNIHCATNYKDHLSNIKRYL